MCWCLSIIELKNARRNIEEKKEFICILYNQQDASYTMFFIIISALHAPDVA